MAPKVIGKPGEKSPLSGQVTTIGPRGGQGSKETTVIKGHTLPPTEKPGQVYVVVDRTKNKSGKG